MRALCTKVVSETLNNLTVTSDVFCLPWSLESMFLERQQDCLRSWEMLCHDSFPEENSPLLDPLKCTHTAINIKWCPQVFFLIFSLSSIFRLDCAFLLSFPSHLISSFSHSTWVQSLFSRVLWLWTNNIIPFVNLSVGCSLRLRSYQRRKVLLLPS